MAYRVPTIKAIIKIEKSDEYPNRAIAIFPEEVSRRNADSCVAYAHIGQHTAIDDFEEFLKSSCRDAQTPDEKEECFNLMMEVISQYRIGDPVDVVWINGNFTEADFKKWRRKRVRDLRNYF